MQRLILALKADKFARYSAIYLMAIAIIGFTVPLLSFWDLNYFDPNAILTPSPPSWPHILGQMI